MGSNLPVSDNGTLYGQGTYSVFTGTDIYTVFRDTIISTMQGLSYSITRQKAPIYTMGSPDPRAIARSKRGVAGSMIMTTFDRHALSGFMGSSQFAAKKGSIEQSPANPYYNTTGGLASGSNLLGTNSIQTANPLDMGFAAGVSTNLVSGTSGMSSVAKPLFTDQLMPFDTTLSAANEYGDGSAMRIFAIEILNEGSGVSIDDTSNEVQMTYICRLITPWVQANNISKTVADSAAPTI